MLSPNLYQKTPPPGQVAQYLPIVKESAINIAVLQPTMSPWYWWRDRLKAELMANGSRCEIREMKGVRDRFFFRPDATSTEIKLAMTLPMLIQESIVRLHEIGNVAQ